MGLFGVVGWGKGGGDDVNAGTAVGSVKDETGGGVTVVGDLGALVGGEEDCGVTVAGGYDGEAAGGEGGTEACREG